MCNSNIGPNKARLRDIRLRNFGDLEFDLSRSHKVKCEGAIELPIYGFLFMVNSYIWPSTALLREISLQHLSDLECDLSRSVKDISNGTVGLPIYDFLLVSNSNYVSHSHCLGVIATRKI